MKDTKIKHMVLLAMLSAVAYIIVCLPHIPVVLFLSYEAKDVVITIGGFLLGPVAAFAISFVVSLLEMVTISQTGPIGALMNLLSTCAFACTASLIYKKKRTLTGAVLGLLLGSVTTVVLLLLWNYLVTPLYMGVDRTQVAGLLIPAFLPFNVLKAGLNSAFVLFLYKPLVTALRKTGLIETGSRPAGSAKPALYLIAAVLLIGCILLLLVLRGVI